MAANQIHFSWGKTSVTVDATAVIAPVDDKIYSGFIEHLGRGVYGGLIDDHRAPSPKELLTDKGYRKDVSKLLKDELHMPVMRWPGGNYVSNYHWEDGIGPKELRPKRIELAWLGDPETNQFGTNEFLEWCVEHEMQPYICFNMGSGTLQEALAWLEYCNGTGDTHWANLRRKHTGKQEAWGVKLWGLGNEMWGPWQVGNMDEYEYAAAAKRWAHALRLVDPSIKLVACGNQGNSNWDRVVTKETVKFVDYHSIHFYSMLGWKQRSFGGGPDAAYEKNVFGAAAAERGIDICQSLIELATIEDGVDPRFSVLNPDQNRARKVRICYDEFNVWDKDKGTEEGGLEQWYDYTDMLGLCAWLNVFIRKAKEVEIACLAQSVNVIAPLMTSPTGLVKQSLYFPLYLFCNYMRYGVSVKTSAASPQYSGPTYPEWISKLCDTPWLDTSAVVVDGEGGKFSLRVAILNRHETADWEGPINFVNMKLGSTAEVHEIYSDNLTAINTFEKPNEVGITTKKINSAGWENVFKVKAHSFVMVVADGYYEA